MSSEQLGLPSALDCDSASGPHRYQVLACSTAPPTLRRAGARRLVRSRRLPLEQSLGLLSSDMTSATSRMLCDVQLKTVSTQRRALMPIQVGQGIAVRATPPRVQRLYESPRKSQKKAHVPAQLSPSAKRLRPSSIRADRHPLPNAGQPLLRSSKTKLPRSLPKFDLGAAFDVSMLDSKLRVPGPLLELASVPTSTLLSSFGAFRTVESTSSVPSTLFSSESFRVITIRLHDRGLEEFSTASPMANLIRNCVDGLRVERGEPLSARRAASILPVKEVRAHATAWITESDVGVGLVRRATDSRVPPRGRGDRLSAIHECPNPRYSSGSYVVVPSSPASRPMRSVSTRTARKPAPPIDDNIYYPDTHIDRPVRPDSFDYEASVAPMSPGTKHKMKAKALLARLAGKRSSKAIAPLPMQAGLGFVVSAPASRPKDVKGSGGLKVLSVEANLPRLKSGKGASSQYEYHQSSAITAMQCEPLIVIPLGLGKDGSTD
ncbi:hypothetical protein FA95DRAFT_1592968 [Auriscalpium vulgare]|uniref:Uncharacterized protein n=1 Tax=Auriscalpium vulgare TaxID=40419 RepID=A0ACB8S6K9_9AGAM|nr:hypothetical protein FA95DRAFT_1592968 [Auriscalpium vulgare]